MKKNAAGGRMPEWVEPMAATLTQERFTGPEWSFERKFDGIRLLAYKKGKRVELFSRNRLPQKLPAVAQAIAKLPNRELILDGEITWHAPFSYHIFDIMWIDGREVMSLPLEERRELLKQLPLTPPLRRVTELKVSEARAVAGARQRGSSPTVREGVSQLRVVARSTDDLVPPWEHAQAEGWEGVIAKRRGSVYEQRRSRNWLKMKCELAQEFVVGGFTEPQGQRVGLGALLVGYYEYVSGPGVSAGVPEPSVVATGPSEKTVPRDFVFAGKIGTGFNNELLADLRRKLDALEIPKPPFTKAIGLPRLRAHWVRPEIVVQVGFIQWTKHNKLRHPRLLGIRHDKHAREVVRE